MQLLLARSEASVASGANPSGPFPSVWRKTGENRPKPAKLLVLSGFGTGMSPGRARLRASRTWLRTIRTRLQAIRTNLRAVYRNLRLAGTNL